jgi:protein O-mannosyl-transferase
VTTPDTISRAQGRTIPIAIATCLFLVVLWAFLSATRSGFISVDDELFVTENAHVQRGLTREGVAWALRQPVAANWHPLTTLSHMLDCQLYGLTAWGHHLTNILLHAASTALLFVVFRNMTGAVWRAAVLAALFGLHPLRVESVAWVAERKDVLSTLFWMLTLLTYVRYAQQSKVSSRKSRVSYGLALTCFVFGLMSKPMLVTLPFVLLLLDYWPLQRFEPKTWGSRLKAVRHLVWEKLPFFALSAIFSLVTFLVQRAAGAVDTQIPLEARLANALVSHVRYLGKMFWPDDLSVFYPHPGQWPGWQVLAAAVILGGLFGIAVWQAGGRPYLAVGWLWFCGMLVPVIGLVQVGSASMADRYSYVPSIGLLVALVWGVHELFARRRHRTLALALLGGAATLLCLALTRRQLEWWKDEETLLAHALAVTQNQHLANYKLGVDSFNLGVTLSERGDFDRAIRYFERAILLSPGKDDAHRALAHALLRTGQIDRAIREYDLALRLNSNDAEAHNNLASILARHGQAAQALEHLKEALRLKPDYPEAHDNLGSVLSGRGRYEEAEAAFREVLRLKPDYPGARQRLERALAAQGKWVEVLAPYRQVLERDPADTRARLSLTRVLLEAGQLDEALEQSVAAARQQPRAVEAQYQLGVALSRKGEVERAARQFELVLELDGGFAAAHYALGILRKQQRQMSEALRHWREAARLAPQWPDPLNNLAWALATDPQAEVRDGLEAVKLATRAVELAGTNNVGLLDTLGAAYAEAGRFAEAAAAGRQAQAAALAQGRAVLAEQIGRRLALYNSNQAYRQEPGER